MFFPPLDSIPNIRKKKPSLVNIVQPCILGIICLLDVVCISIAIPAVVKKPNLLWCHHVPDIFSLSIAVHLWDLSAYGQWGLACWETPCSVPLLWTSAVPQHPYSHCCIRRLIFSQCSPIFSLRCWKSALADLIVCLLWAHPHRHYPGLASWQVYLSWPWWCQRFWHSLSLLWLCPVVTFTPHMVLPACRYSKRLSLLLQLSSQVPSWGWREPHTQWLLYVWSPLSAGHGMICCHRYIHLLILICSCTWNVPIILGCALSWLVPPCTWWVMRAVTGSLCQVSGPGLAGTDRSFARRQIASQRLKVFDLKGILSIVYRCLESRKTSKGCLIFPGESML